MLPVNAATTIPMIAYWQGRPVTELTKEELVEALAFTAEQLRQNYEQMAREREMWNLMVQGASGK